jgi:hypothetical protein
MWAHSFMRNNRRLSGGSIEHIGFVNSSGEDAMHRHPWMNGSSPAVSKWLKLSAGGPGNRTAVTL